MSRILKVTAGITEVAKVAEQFTHNLHQSVRAALIARSVARSARLWAAMDREVASYMVRRRELIAQIDAEMEKRQALRRS